MEKNISSKCGLVAKKTQKSNINIKKYSILYINKMFLILVFYFSSFSLEKTDEKHMFALSGGLLIQLSFDWQKWSICLIAKMKDRFPLHKSYMQIFNLSITNSLLFHDKWFFVFHSVTFHRYYGMITYSGINYSIIFEKFRKNRVKTDFKFVNYNQTS